MKNRVMMKKTFVLLTGGALLLAGCQAGAPSADKPAAAPISAEKKSEPLKISLLLKYFSTEPPTKAAEAFKVVEDYTHTKLDIIWAPSPSYDEKVNTTLASGNVPQVLLVSRDRADNIVAAVKSGAFWEIGPYLKNYPNISKAVGDIRLYNVSQNGKVYGIPSARDLSENALIYRKDWLDNLGMKPPTTVDELYAMMKAFTQKDPDKNGKDDTFGVIENDGSGIFNQIKVWMGGPNGWSIKNGKLVPEFMSDEYKQAMDFMRKLYQEKLINQDFPVTKQNQMLDYLGKSRGGGYAGAYAQFSNGWHTPLQKANPDAKLDFIYKIKSSDGKYYKQAGGGYNGVFMFPKSSVKSEAALKEILDFFEKLADDKMRTLIKLGIEGKHYKMDNGKPVIINPELFSDEVIPLRWIMVADGITDRTAVGLTPLDERITKAQEDKEITYTSNPAFPFTSKLIVDDKIIEDARTKYILGEIDDNGWKASIEKWRTNRGDQLIEEYQKQYDSAQANRK
ncbi:extracellular solute-binding protein [Paenibacillus thalictri]|nr:extracellular solute-binding protein [Paenibacillus thalictri]